MRLCCAVLGLCQLRLSALPDGSFCLFFLKYFDAPLGPIIISETSRAGGRCSTVKAKGIVELRCNYFTPCGGRRTIRSACTMPIYPPSNFENSNYHRNISRRQIGLQRRVSNTERRSASAMAGIQLIEETEAHCERSKQ